MIGLRIYRFVAIAICGFLSLTQNLYAQIGSTTEVMFFGAVPHQADILETKYVAEQYAKPVNVSVNDKSHLSAISNDQSVLAVVEAITSKEAQEYVENIINVLSNFDHKPKTTILLLANPYDLSWLKNIVTGEYLRIVIATPQSDIAYISNLLDPIEEKIGFDIPVSYDYSGLTTLTMSQLWEVNEDEKTANVIHEAGVFRAGFESGVVKIASHFPLDAGEKVKSVMASHFTNHNSKNTMFLGAELFSDELNFNKHIANIAMSTNCCDNGTCSWEEYGTEIYSFRNIGQLK